ncbi:hypothetical protein VTN02DRAFT_555 [Thermoascus thermophilus]
MVASWSGVGGCSVTSSANSPRDVRAWIVLSDAWSSVVVAAAVADACLRMLSACVDAGSRGLWKSVITSRGLGFRFFRFSPFVDFCGGCGYCGGGEGGVGLPCGTWLRFIYLSDRLGVCSSSSCLSDKSRVRLEGLSQLERETSGRGVADRLIT